MSDEQRKDEEPEVEAHRGTQSVSDSPRDEVEDENDVEAHVLRRSSARMD